jgi:hypothetical protein
MQPAIRRTGGAGFSDPPDFIPREEGKSMVPGRRPEIKAWEAAGAALALLAGFHFLALRVRAGGLPVGDEGSWLSVASELARGQGFSTRWLEGHYLLPYALPRPDDFRYPALTSLLALVFRIFGQSVEAARWTVTWVFLGFAASLWLVARSAFGRWAGLAGLSITVFSLLQLEWNSLVYTEGLFGLVTMGLAAWCLHGEGASSRDGGGARMTALSWWAGLGAGVALLYLVRTNGILFLSGIPWLWWRNRRRLSWKHPAIAIACFALVAAPWLIRSAVHFGNPLHVAGNAGMLREHGESHTLSAAEYFSHYDALFPLKRLGMGLLNFFSTLRFYEHGLEVVPLVLIPIAAFLRRPFFNSFLTAGFSISFLASIYASYHSWAGVRYMSGLLPLAYAYGLGAVPALASRLPIPRAGRAAPGLAGTACILLLLTPVVYPHRFYERKLAHPSGNLGRPLAEHLDLIRETVPAGGAYYAASLCRVNFLAEGLNCVGLQELYDTSWFSRSLRAFHPGLIALTHGETGDGAMQKALSLMRERGYTQDTLASGTLGVYLTIRPLPAGSQAFREDTAMPTEYPP